MGVLIADDSSMSRRLLEETVKSWGYEVTMAADGVAAWEILNGPSAPSLAILDWMMPGFTGPELCKMIRDRGGEPYTYVLLLTARNEKDDLVAGMDSGADDYITKPFDKHELKVRLRAGTRIVNLQKQVVATREALRIQATRDYLTNVPNRSAILDVLSRELARSEREGTHVGLVLADIDHFKSINDTYGHLAGDAALREVSARMQSCMRQYDAIGRYGGEEFLIVLPGADEEATKMQAERMRASVRATPVTLEGQSVRLTCTFGCTSSSRAVSAEDLIRLADEALYRGKRSGRDCAVASPSLHVDLAETVTA